MSIDIRGPDGRSVGQFVPSVDTIEQEFRRLVEDWKATRRPTSSAAKMADHPAYQRIIEMGKQAPESVVPLLLAELESRPDHWFIALHGITEANPVPVASRGLIHDMTAAWVRWGKENGFMW